ncbi:hypothetical protein ACXWR7_10775, partial [Streptococcus pyogenes]
PPFLPSLFLFLLFLSFPSSFLPLPRPLAPLPPPLPSLLPLFFFLLSLLFFFSLFFSLFLLSPFPTIPLSALILEFSPLPVLVFSDQAVT